MANPLFDTIYAVGDSMSDSGGIYHLTSEALSLAQAAGVDTEGLQPIPVSPPYAGKFSNGPVLPEITANLLGAKLVNFSFGGAEALGTQTLLQAAGPALPSQVLTQVAALPATEQAPIDAVLNHNINLSGQLADFVAQTSVQPPPAHSAFLSMIGLNDFQALIASAASSNPLALIGEAAQVAGGIVQAELAAAYTAYAQGIGTVIFETLPAPSFFPIGSELPPELQAIGATAVSLVNDGLEADAFALRQQGHDARVVDLAGIANEISANPAAFGFQDFHEPTLLGNGVEFTPNPAAPPPDQIAFFDPLHATTILHGVLGEFAAASLSHGGFVQPMLPGTITIDGLTLGGLHFAVGSYYELDVEAARSILGLSQPIAPDAPATVVGSNLDNLILGGVGDDTIDGGGGYNIVAYSQPEQQFTITLNGATLTVEDRSSSSVTDTPINFSEIDGTAQLLTPHAEGTDALANIQKITFSDGSTLDTSWLTKAASLPADQMGTLVNLYSAYFDRAPDAVGLDYWASRLSDGMSLQLIAKSFFGQPETMATFPANMSNQDFVTKIYNNVLGRAPDQTGFDYWVNQLQTGKLTKDVFILAVIGGAQAATGSPIDAQYLANKQAVGEHFAIDQGLGDVTWATNVMAHVDTTAASVVAANALTDGYAGAAVTSDPHLVVQLVGINTATHV